MIQPPEQPPSSGGSPEFDPSTPLFPTGVIYNDPQLNIKIPGGFAYGDMQDLPDGRRRIWFQYVEVEEGRKKGRGEYLIRRFLREAIDRGASELITLVQSPIALRISKRMAGGGKLAMMKLIDGQRTPVGFDDAHDYLGNQLLKDGEGIEITIDLTDPAVQKDLTDPEKLFKPLKDGAAKKDVASQSSRTRREPGELILNSGTTLADVKHNLGAIIAAIPNADNERRQLDAFSLKVMGMLARAKQELQLADQRYEAARRDPNPAEQTRAMRERNVAYAIGNPIVDELTRYVVAAEAAQKKMASAASAIHVGTGKAKEILDKL